MPGHHHDHQGHHHSHGVVPVAESQDFTVPLAIGTALNIAFVIVEVVFGLKANSVALVADAGHNLGDVLGLMLAAIAALLARRLPTATHTYGLRKATILSALANSVLMLVTVGAIGFEAVQLLFRPAEVASLTVMGVAAAGIVVNGLTAWLLAAGRKGDVNLRAAFLHMLYDALISVGVLVSGGVIYLTGWTWLDPLISLIIAFVILGGTWNLLRESVDMSLDAVPTSIKLKEVAEFLSQQPGVTAIHDLHIWPISTTETALTCHCLMPAGHPGDEFLAHVAGELQAHFGIGHTTLQVEVNEHIACVLESDQVV